MNPLDDRFPYEEGLEYEPPASWYGGGGGYEYPADEPAAPAPSPPRKKAAPPGPPDFGPDAPPRGSGLVLGRFMPPHAGHRFLLDFARKYAERLTVLVYSTPDDPIPGILRVGWVSELFPGVEVRGVTDPPPAQPRTDPAYWKAWLEIVRRHVPSGPDWIFASDPEVANFAGLLGARYLPVDPDRRVVPISATRIRKDPMGSWSFLPSCVRPHFVRKVCLLGPDSTGKTTLARDLAELYRTVAVPEFARTYLDALQRDCEPADIRVLAHGQAAAEDALARQANRLLLCDTSLLSAQLWSERLFGASPRWVRDQAARRRYDLFLVTGTDVPWVGDASRDRPEERAAFHKRCIEELTARNWPYVSLTGDWETRYQAACAAIDALLAAPAGAPGDPEAKQ